MRLFLDTSALAKRYIAEQGSDKVLRLCREAEQLAVSVICLPELISALNRLVRERRLSRPQYRMLKRTLLDDLAGADLCELTSA
ncbi:MAG: type II toxin-antitoxin system VapC family toxin, partial [Gammaproteobacteria bacterium]